MYVTFKFEIDVLSKVGLDVHKEKVLLALITPHTKVQTLSAIWLKYWNIWIENTLHVYVLGEHTSMKNELYQTNVKSQGVIYRTAFQHNLH